MAIVAQPATISQSTLVREVSCFRHVSGKSIRFLLIIFVQRLPVRPHHDTVDLVSEQVHMREKVSQCFLLGIAPIEFIVIQGDGGVAQRSQTEDVETVRVRGGTGIT